LQAISASSALGLMGNLKYFLIEAKKNEIPYHKIYEVILQNYLFAGFPAGIEGMICLSETFPEKEHEKKHIKNDYLNYKETFERGENLCQKVYGKNFDKLMKNLASLCPELAEWMIFEGYGKTLSRPFLDVLTRELCSVATLTVLDWKRQLISHIKGSRNVGASEPEIRETILQTCLFLDKSSVENSLKLLELH
jgi:4-carboxymuconolactone decarboxylase